MHHLGVLARVEHHSEHVVGVAQRRAAQQHVRDGERRGVLALEVEEAQVIVGRGVGRLRIHPATQFGEVVQLCVDREGGRRFAPVKRNRSHTHATRTTPHTTRQEQHHKRPHEHPLQTLNNARRRLAPVKEHSGLTHTTQTKALNITE